MDITTVAEYVEHHCGGRHTNIEMDGIGAGVYDILNHSDTQKSRSLTAVTVGAGTSWRDKSQVLEFENVRAAMWWNVRELLDPDYGDDICLPPIKEIQDDLTAPKWGHSKSGTVLLESKKQMRTRIGRSTDIGDAICLAFWQTSGGGGVVF